MSLAATCCGAYDTEEMPRTKKLQIDRAVSFLPSIVAGIIVVLVGFASSAALVFAAAKAAGANQTEIGSWLGALCLGVGLLSLGFSYLTREPVTFAWSTAGAAMLVSGLNGVTLPEAIGAFLFNGALIVLVGATGWFERAMNRIPLALGSALLAGVLFRFAVEAVGALRTTPVLAVVMFVSFLIFKRVLPRYAMALVLLVGAVVCASMGLFHLEGFQPAWLQPVFTVPQFSPTVLLSVGVPLFLVTMTSQNVTGAAILRTYGFHTRVSAPVTASGIATLLLAPFGAFAVNLSAVAAAIVVGPECNEDSKKRYVAGIVSGTLYIVLALCAGTISSLFASLPREFIFLVAGLALTPAIAGGLATATKSDREREPAFLAFLVTASGVSVLGIASAFWGIVAGLLAQTIFDLRRQPQPGPSEKA